MKRIFYCQNCSTKTITESLNFKQNCCSSPNVIELGEMYAKDEEVKQVEGYHNKNNEFRLLQNAILELLARKDADSYYKATERIVEYLEQNYNIFTITDDKNSEVWFYNSSNGIYEPNGETKIRIIIREIVRSAYTAVIAKNVLDKIKSERSLQVSLKEFVDFHYHHVYEIPVVNGILNILTKELSAFTPEKRFFSCIPITYNPAAICPNTIEHFKSILKNEDDLKVMEEIYGCGLLRDYKIEKAIIYVGNGRNGKGKTLEHKRRFFGAENCSHLPLKCLAMDSFEIEDMFGKLMNISGDLSSETMKDTDLFKMATGRDTLLAKRKFRSAIKFVNYAKHIFACNDLPRVYDSSKGFWSRWVLLEFPYTFVSQEDYDKAEDKSSLKIMNINQVERLSTPEELSGWLNHALDGLQRVLKNKDYSYTIGSQQIKEFWIRKADSFLAFCLDFMETDISSNIPKSKLRQIYSNYCKNYNINMVGEKSIKITLESEFGASENRIYDNTTGKQIMFWEGIKIKDERNEKLARVAPLFEKVKKSYIGETNEKTLSNLANLNVEVIKL